jgi:hypothetical protein
MEQPCHKCGQAVEEGIAFCPHCSAPQIRVVVAEPVAGTVSSATAAASNDSIALAAPPTLPGIALPMRWSATVTPCALAAVLASVPMILGHPFVAMASVGVLAVVFYRQRQPGIATRAGLGARLGALSGLLWFGMSVILPGLFVLALHKGPEIRDEVLKRIQQTAPNTNDPQVQALFSYFKTPAGLSVMIAMAIVFTFVAALALGALGGALAGAVLGRRNKG